MLPWHIHIFLSNKRQVINIVMLWTTVGDVISNWYWSNKRKLRLFRCHELQKTGCTFVRCLSDVRMVSGYRSIAISAALQPHLSTLPSIHTRLPLSELQSAGIGRCDGSPEKISMSNGNKKNYVKEKKDNRENASSLAGSKNILATCESSVTTLADFDLFILFVLRDFVCILQPLLTVLLLLTATLPVFCTVNDPLSKHKEQFSWSFAQESITTYVLAVSPLQDSYLVNLPISFGSTEC